MIWCRFSRKRYTILWWWYFSARAKPLAPDIFAAACHFHISHYFHIIFLIHYFSDIFRRWCWYDIIIMIFFRAKDKDIIIIITPHAMLMPCLILLKMPYVFARAQIFSRWKMIFLFSILLWYIIADILPSDILLWDKIRCDTRKEHYYAKDIIYLKIDTARLTRYA